jgi:hypothetical protein
MPERFNLFRTAPGHGDDHTPDLSRIQPPSPARRNTEAFVMENIYPDDRLKRKTL